MTGPPEQNAFLGVHAVWFSLSILSFLLFYLRPRPRVALAVLVLMHGGAYLAYYGNLPRTYAVGVSSDRALGVGMALSVADGGSAFDHVQIEFGNLEPLWTFTVAALSGFSASRVPFVYDHMTLLVLALTALGFYWGWSSASPGEDQDAARWRGVLVAAAVLGLSSVGMSADSPSRSFWHGNFVFKPNHALAFGLVGVLSRWPTARRSWVSLGLIQALLIWAFILDWAYVLPGLALAALLEMSRKEAIKRLLAGTAFGLVLGLPYVLHLLRDYSPVGPGEMPDIWRDHMGQRLASPFWWTLDLAPIVLLFILGLAAARSSGAKDNRAFAFLLTGPLVAVCYLVGLQFGFAPEIDEGSAYWRMIAAAGAGYGLWWVASKGDARRRYALAYALILACSFPGYFNPNRHDRYYVKSSQPFAPSVLAVANWIRANTGGDSVLISSEGITLSGLTGRHFLMVRPDQTADRAARDAAESDILTSLDESTVRRAADRYRISHVILDDGLRKKYGESLRGLGNRGWFEPALANSFASILVLKKPTAPR
ncbi:MAG: hypothetical protein ABI672_02140 [Vicinamibacteria bacterium]